MYSFKYEITLSEGMLMPKTHYPVLNYSNFVLSPYRNRPLLLLLQRKITVHIIKSAFPSGKDGH